MKYEKKALEMAKAEEKDMLLRGTSYRLETARYVTQFFSDLVNAGRCFNLSLEDLKEEIRNKYTADTERMNDVTKGILVLLAKVKDEDRLVEHYERATNKIKKRDADRKS